MKGMGFINLIYLTPLLEDIQKGLKLRQVKG